MQTKEQIFWQWFEINQEKYYSSDDQPDSIYTELNNQLSSIDEDLTFEFSPVDKHGTKEFFVSADGISSSFPSVEKLVASAPKLKHWKITAFRQRTPGTEWQLHYQAITIGFEDVFFRYAPDSTKIHVELTIRGFQDTPAWKSATYLFLDGLLGEYDTQTYLGDIEFLPLEESKRATLSQVVGLRDLVDSLKFTQKKQLL